MSQEAVADVAIEAAPETAQEVKQPEPRKPTKQELKRQQIFMDRIKRHMAKGLTFQDAQRAIQKEDYDRMPIAEKVKRLENILAMNLHGMYQDIKLVKSNQDVLADAMDVNFKGFEKILKKLGVSDEERKQLMDEAEAEFKAEREAAIVAAEAKQAKQTEDMQKQEVVDQVDQPGEAQEPADADTFGG